MLVDAHRRILIAALYSLVEANGDLVYMREGRACKAMSDAEAPVVLTRRAGL
jgi:hypothetical protein